MTFIYVIGCKVQDIKVEDSPKKFQAIVSCDESYVDMLSDVDGGSLISECLFNDDKMTSDSKIANNTESLSENMDSLRETISFSTLLFVSVSCLISSSRSS